MSRVRIHTPKPKLIVILGPTASGKSELAIKLALRLSSGQAKKEFIKGVEIISADSRQVYKGMDIGTGKVPRDPISNSEFLPLRGISRREIISKQPYFHQRIEHHLLDVVSPKRRFTVAQYRKLALKAIDKIFKKKRAPILCGGTGFYIQAVIDGIILPEVPPDWKLRKELEKKSTTELFTILRKLDKKRAKNIDSKNPRRLIRAIEIVLKTKKAVPLSKKEPLPYPVLIIGIKKSKKELKKKVLKRVEKMIKIGLEKEAKKLVKRYGWIPVLQTIGYQEWKDYWRGRINKNEVKEKIILHTLQFAKRQMTWFTRQNFASQNLDGFKRDRKIRWCSNYKKAERLVIKFLRN